jgi:YD repeat-containing protein
MTARKKLTNLAVHNLKPGAARREIPDGGQSNLYIIVQPSGRRRYAVRYRFAGKPRKLTLARGLSLAEARAEAATAMADVERGIDPAGERETEKAKKAEAAENTLAAVSKMYMQLAGNKLRSARSRQSILDRLLLPRLGSKPMTEIEREDVIRVLDRIEVENGPRMADMTLAVLGRIFNWFEIRTSRFRSPLVRGMQRVKPAERARTRMLSDEEIRLVWNACGDQRLQVYGAAFRFLLLTAARRSEATGMKRSEVEDGVWTLPKERSKNGQEIVRPLSRAAIEVIASVPVIAGSEFVFTVSGTSPVHLDSGRDNAKKRLDDISGVKGWVIHDLRRCARSLLSRAGVPYDAAELCLGHRLPGGLIRQTYDRHGFVEEKRRAFEQLAREIERIIAPPPAGKVVALRR